MSEAYEIVSAPALTIAGGNITITSGTVAVSGGTVGISSQYPAGATPLSASGTGANSVVAATLTGVAGKITYITGFEVTGSGAVVGLPVTVTVTGILGGTLSYTYSAIAGVLLGNGPLVVTYAIAVPASAPNVSIVVSCPQLGLGNTNNTVVAHGYLL